MPDEVTFRESAGVTRRLGGRSMVMLSGYRWTIEATSREGEHHSNQERFDRELARWMVHDRTGNPVVDTSDKPNDYHGQKWSRMCRATDFAKDTIVDVSKYFVENGYSVIHFGPGVQRGLCGVGLLGQRPWPSAGQRTLGPSGHGRPLPGGCAKRVGRSIRTSCCRWKSRTSCICRG